MNWPGALVITSMVICLTIALGMVLHFLCGNDITTSNEESFQKDWVTWKSSSTIHIPFCTTTDSCCVHKVAHELDNMPTITVVKCNCDKVIALKDGIWQYPDTK